ncbi:MAG: hypothetical protein ACRDTC_04410 [Pseudonocardiaceae bacterium]
MTTAEKKLVAVLTFAAVLVPLVLSAAFDWSAWSWLLLTVVLLAVPGLMIQNIQRRGQRDRLRNPYAAQPVEEDKPAAQQTPIVDVALPSSVADYDFRFSATAYWHAVAGSTVRHADLGCLATDALVARARAITAAEHPSRVDALQHRLAAMLGAVALDRSRAVEAWAEQVTLTLPELDLERLRKHSEVRKDKEIWEHERDHERSKRQYLGDDVLKSTGSAVVWWLTRKDNDIEEAVRLIGALAQLSAAANDRDVPELFRHLVPVSALPGQSSFDPWDGDQRFSDGSSARSGPAVLMDAPLDIDEDQRPLFARRFAQLVDMAGKPEAAEEIRRRFDTPVVDEPAETPAPDHELQDRLVPDGQLPQDSGRSSPLSEESGG